MFQAVFGLQVKTKGKSSLFSILRNVIFNGKRYGSVLPRKRSATTVQPFQRYREVIHKCDLRITLTNVCVR